MGEFQVFSKMNQLYIYMYPLFPIQVITEY